MISDVALVGNFTDGSDVLRQLRNRNPEFLTEVFEQTTPVLLKVLAANGIFADTAEDLVHQVWERFFTNIDKFEGRSELRTFICGILMNKIREHRRMEGRLVLEDDADTVLERAFNSQGWWNVAPPDPSARVYSEQLSTSIEECIDGLTELQKAAFILKEVDQDDSDEICNVLGISLSNLRVLIFRAKDKLRKCLEGRLGVRSGLLE